MPTTPTDNTATSTSPPLPWHATPNGGRYTSDLYMRIEREAWSILSPDRSSPTAGALAAAIVKRLVELFGIAPIASAHDPRVCVCGHVIHCAGRPSACAEPGCGCTDYVRATLDQLLHHEITRWTRNAEEVGRVLERRPYERVAEAAQRVMEHLGDVLKERARAQQEVTERDALIASQSDRLKYVSDQLERARADHDAMRACREQELDGLLQVKRLIGDRCDHPATAARMVLKELADARDQRDAALAAGKRSYEAAEKRATEAEALVTQLRAEVDGMRTAAQLPVIDGTLMVLVPAGEVGRIEATSKALREAVAGFKAERDATACNCGKAMGMHDEEDVCSRMPMQPAGVIAIRQKAYAEGRAAARKEVENARQAAIDDHARAASIEKTANKAMQEALAKMREADEKMAHAQTIEREAIDRARHSVGKDLAAAMQRAVDAEEKLEKHQRVRDAAEKAAATARAEMMQLRESLKKIAAALGGKLPNLSHGEELAPAVTMLHDERRTAVAEATALEKRVRAAESESMALRARLLPPDGSMLIAVGTPVTFDTGQMVGRVVSFSHEGREVVVSDAGFPTEKEAAEQDAAMGTKCGTLQAQPGALPFWMVWSPQGKTPPKVRHASGMEAYAEAQRLARANLGAEFYVLAGTDEPVGNVIHALNVATGSADCDRWRSGDSIADARREPNRVTCIHCLDIPF